MIKGKLLAAALATAVISLPAAAVDINDLKDMTPQERKDYLASLTEAEREALKEQRRAKREQRRAEWEAMTPEEREAKKAEMKANRKGKKGRGKKRRDGGEQQ